MIQKSESFSNEKNEKRTKRVHAFKGYSSSYYFEF